MLVGGVILAAAVAATLDDQVHSAATLASITLAILTFFTARRAQKLAEDRDAGLGGMSPAALVAFACDLMLAVATFGALAAMLHLFRDSFSISQWTDRDHVVESLFSIAYLGFVVLFVTQLGFVGYRSWVAIRNQVASR